MAYLLRDTGIQPHLVAAAIEREGAVNWDKLPSNAYTKGGLYLHYAFETGEIDGIPVRQSPYERRLARLRTVDVDLLQHNHGRELTSIVTHLTNMLAENHGVPTELTED